MYCFTICSAICFFQVAFTWPTDIRERELFTRETNGLGIEGSVLTNVKKLPYQAAILSKGNYIGAGAVIGNKFILTAYFVVAGYGSDLNVRVGSNKALEGGQLLDVGKVITHNKTKNYSYNVALLKLKTAIKFSSLVKPIKLATSEKNNGSVVVISGYGYTAGQYPGNYGKLQSGKQKTIKTVTCQSFYTELILDESNSCAYSPKVCACNDGTNDFLPKLPSPTRAFGSANEGVGENLEDAKKIKDQTQLNFLLIGFNDGKVRLSVFGLFPCGTVDTRNYLGGEESSIEDAVFSQDIKSLFIVVRTKTTKYLKLLVLDTKILSSRSRELHALALKHGHIISFLDYLAVTMHSITEAWENIFLLEIESKLASYAESMPEGSVSADFLELLMFGTTSDALEKFLMHDLNDKGIKKLGHSIELSHSNIQKLILKHLLSVGQSLAYHLSELKGMAKLTDRFRDLGLNEETVAAAFSAAGAFLVKSTEVQLVIDDSMKKYKAFFRWLYAVILRMTDDRIPDLTFSDVNQQDLSFIADYLHGLESNNKMQKQNFSTKFHCYLDRLGQYLLNQELVNPPDSSNNTWQQLLEDNPCLLQHPTIIPRYKKMSLVQQHSHLKETIEDIFKTPATAIGNLFHSTMVLDLLEVEGKIRLTMCHLPDEQKLTLAVIKMNTAPTFFQFIEIPIEHNAAVKQFSVYFTSVDKLPMKVLDIQFYLPETLSVLLEPKGENRSAVFVQQPTKPIRESTCDIVEGNSLVESVALRPVVDMVASSFAVSGSRKVAVVLSESRRKVRLFEMEVEEEEEEEDGMDGTLSSARDSENSVLDTSKVSETD